MNRIEIIKNEIELDPKDPFNYYLLSLEYLKTDEKIKAEENFNYLLDEFDQYLATYYTYAQYLIEIGKDDKAQEIINKGIEISINQNNTKTEKELKQLLELNY